MLVNEWTIEALRKRGVIVNQDGSLDICYFGSKTQHVPDVPTAIRQQQHIVDQQKEEQKENEEIGVLMRQFHDTVSIMSKMTIESFTEELKSAYLEELNEILIIMSRKTEKLRKDGYERLMKVYKMLEKSNLPAANLSSQAALDRMRKRWLVNEKVIDKSLIRLEALKQLK